jgi:hypothetical protein
LENFEAILSIIDTGNPKRNQNEQNLPPIIFRYSVIGHSDTYVIENLQPQASTIEESSSRRERQVIYSIQAIA